MPRHARLAAGTSKTYPVCQYYQNVHWHDDVDDHTMFGSYVWNSASVDSDLLKVRVYGALIHCIKDSESEHMMTLPKTVRQVKTRLTQLRHFRDNVAEDRFHMQEHGSLLRVEVSLKMRQAVLHTVQFADGVRRELLHSMEIQRIPWGDWTVSVNHLLDMCTQCNIERCRNDTPLSRNMSELIAQTMNEVGVATEGIAGCLPPVTSATFRWQAHVQQPVAVGTGAPQRMAVGGAVLDVVEVDNMETVRRLVFF